MTNTPNTTWEITNNIKTPRILTEILWDPAFQALLKLSEKKPFPNKWTPLTLLTMYFPAKEDFIKYKNSLRIKLLNKSWVSENSALEILEEKIQWIQDLRELYEAWFLTTDVIRHLFAMLCDNWKASIIDIISDDKKMFWMNNIQIEFFRKWWIAPFSFSSDINSQLIDILEKQNQE